LGHREVGHSPLKALHGGGWAADGDQWGGHSPVVVAIDSWVMEQVEALAILVGMEVGLDGCRCGSTMGRCSRRMRKMMGSLL
jgi:hypothetical protein